MVTNYPQQLTASAAVSSGARGAGTGLNAEDGVIVRAMGKLSQLLCGLSGHDAVLHVEGKRVMMRCTSCGHDTPGWEISERGPRRRYDGDPGRHLLPTRELDLKKTA
jgi:hypothetical protein